MRTATDVFLVKLALCYLDRRMRRVPLQIASLRLVNTRDGLPTTLACVSSESPSTTWTRQRDGLDAERYERCLDETTELS